MMALVNFLKDSLDITCWFSLNVKSNKLRSKAISKQ